MNVQIRRAKTSDYENVSRLIRQVHRLHVHARPDIYEDSDYPMERDYYEYIVHLSRFQIWVVEQESDKKLIAYAMTRVNEEASRPIFRTRKILIIDDLCVDEDRRSQGLGRMLWEHILAYAEEVQAESIELGVSEFNREAILFYEHLGMKTRSRRMEMGLRVHE
ncbi:GNAT family N-acetyltransferase [Paenibacillus aquistagni]|uniref:Acetyltransferase (GNAT) family protein n=1 Tax=Paenibacillus aquistagni TaxID=1852522 RepID=A0A1X7IU91_9BACL|nr:GNAT family N-acetyltransferase [Paenibacillus aquistagni]NMM51078.1 GNAT family N-acetyltransferase [Paenibacillus aquistagni]SMG18400.1 Acetyltransferase (GNAT) family protein [Paenibacillus aquistagni]